MMILFIMSVIYSVRYLRNFNHKFDIYASTYATLGCVFGLLGYLTGIEWVSVTWVTDQGQSFASVLKEPKLIGAAIALLIYGAYFVLRGSFTDIDKRSRVSAVYNIFAFAMLFPAIWIIPRLVGSLHPGAPGSESGNPALDKNDMDLEPVTKSEPKAKAGKAAKGSKAKKKSEEFEEEAETSEV